MRNTIMKAGIVAFASVSLALGATGSVYDEAKVWFRGGYDANGDGIFAASEFVDSSRPKSDTAHQTVTLTGNGVQYNKGAVWSAFNPFYTNTQYYVSLPNGDCAAAADAGTESLPQTVLASSFLWTRARTGAVNGASSSDSSISPKLTTLRCAGGLEPSTTEAIQRKRTVSSCLLASGAT